MQRSAMQRYAVRRYAVRRAATILLCLPLGGCFIARTTVNERIDPARMAKLERGVSSADDVLAALGAPTDVIQLGKRSAWRYDHIVTKRAGIFVLVAGVANFDTQQDRVWLFFDENEKLQHFGATLSADKAKYQMPWERAHD